MAKVSEYALAVAGRLFTWRAALLAAALFIAIEACLAMQSWHSDLVAASTADLALGFALTLAGIFMHELGHLAACRRFGAPHGGIGIGMYWCLPAFYAEVHGAWLLPRMQRAAVDAGGVYFRRYSSACSAPCQLAWPTPALLCAIALSQFLMLHTLNPSSQIRRLLVALRSGGRAQPASDTAPNRPPVVRRDWPNRGELALLAAFMSIAAAYFAYLLLILGRNLAIAAAGVHSAIASVDGSAPATLALICKGALLALVAALALGIALLLARAGRDLISERTSP